MSRAGGADEKRESRKDRCDKREEETNKVTGEETGRGESGGGWEGSGGRSKRTDRITSLWGYTVTYNRRRGRKQEWREKWSGGWMRRVWAVLTLDLAKAGPFIIGSHQALLPVMCWKMGSNAVICFMLPALLHRQPADTHKHTHSN